MNQSKIQTLKRKIQDYQAQCSHCTWEQKHELNYLWIELIYWELVEEGKIQPDPLYFKVQEFWKNLKRAYQSKEKWLYSELKAFLTTLNFVKLEETP